MLIRAQMPEMNKEQADEYIDEDVLRIDSSQYRFGFRDIAASTNERAMICSFLPRQHFAGNTINLQQPFEFLVNGTDWEQVPTMSMPQQLYVCGVLNGFVVDWMLRQKITSHLNMFYVYQVPMPRDDTAGIAKLIIHRAARLICTTPEFDDLAQAVDLTPKTSAGRAEYGATDPTERAKLRAELDGLVAHLYGLSEEEFTHILGTFPLVAQPVKVAAHNAYRDVERGLIK